MLRAGSLRPVLKAQQTPWRPSWRLRQVAPWRGCHISQALRSRLPVGSLLLLLLSRFSRVQLCDPMDCSLPGSSIHGIFQARVLEWGAIAFLHKHTQLLLRGSREPPAELPPRAGHEGSHIRVPYMVPTSLHPRGGT